MRSVLLVALAACGVSSSRRGDDAGIDAPPRPDARPPDAPIDAYVRRPCDAPATFADGLAPTRELHVAAGAVGGDGSQAAPFGSIAAAAAVATPGTFILLGPGVHATNQFIPDLRGTADAPIWIGGVFGTRPIIRGGSEGLHLTRPAYVVIQHLEIHLQQASGINVDDGVSFAGDAHHVALIDLDVHDITGSAAQSCIKVSGVTDLAIHDSRIADCSIGIDQVGVHGAVIARNRLTDMTLFGVQARGGSTDIDVRQNRIHDAGVAGVSMGGSTPLALFRPPVSTTTPNAEARRVRAFDNAVTGTTYAPFALRTCVDCLVAHNLTFGTPGNLLRLLPGTLTQNGYEFEPTSNGRVINNSFIWNASELITHVEVGPNTAPATFTFAHNLWHASDAPSSSTPSLPVAETGSVIGMGTGYDYDASVPFCFGPETNAATALPEVDGTIEGHCRTDPPTIGPQTSGPGCRI